MEIVDQEEELSGPIVSFNGRNNTKIKSLVANIEPVQDLHGYDHPWPGGAGKNLLNIDRPYDTPNPTTINASTSPRVMDTSHYYSGLSRDNYYNPGNVNSVSISDGTISVSSKVSGYGIALPVEVKANTQYTFNAIFNNVYFGFGYWDANWNILSYSGEYNSTITITTPADCAYLVIVLYTYANENGSVSNIQLEEGSTATAYVPYKNICPISGYTGAEVMQTSGNLLKPTGYGGVFYSVSVGTSLATEMDIIATEINDGYEVVISNNWIGKVFATDMLPSGHYYFHVNFTDEALRIALFIADDNYIIKNICGHSSNYEFTLTESGRIVVFITASPAGTVHLHDFQVEVGTSFSKYYPYTGNQISVTFPNEAGTVYGCTITLNPDRTGTLVANRKTMGCTVDSMRSSYQNIAYAQVNKPTDSEDYNSYRKVDIITSKYPVNPAHPSGWDAAVNQGKMFTTPNKDDYWFGFPFGTTLQEAQTALNDCTICYPLAEPIEYTLTAEQVSGILTTLYGTNNIWADTGDITVKIAEKGITAFELAPHT